MRRPLKKKRGVASEYPTLQEFSKDRRRFLKNLAEGALYLGLGGALTGCINEAGGGGGGGSSTDAGLDSSFINPDRGSDSGPDRGRDVSADPERDRRVDADEDSVAHPDTYPEMAGGAPMPPYEQVRFPAEGYSETYIGIGDYIGFAVTIGTYDPNYSQYYRDNVQAGIDACVGAMADASCVDLEDEAGIVELERQILSALNKAYEEAGFSSSFGAELADLDVNFCYADYAIGGDMVFDAGYPDVGDQ